MGRQAVRSLTPLLREDRREVDGMRPCLSHLPSLRPVERTCYQLQATRYVALANLLSSLTLAACFIFDSLTR